jgi:hypothetical protein
LAKAADAREAMGTTVAALTNVTVVPNCRYVGRPVIKALGG